MNNVRIAVLKDSGKRYIVQQIEMVFRPDGELNTDRTKVHCWGEVQRVKGLATKHAESKSFGYDQVTVTEVQKTSELLLQLFEQTVQDLRDRGIRFTQSRKGDVRVYL